jgi:hypothetical protein
LNTTVRSDLVERPAWWLARPVAAILQLDGATPEERRAELMESVTLPGDDVPDLMLRHIARGTVWFVMFGIAFVASLLGMAVVTLLVSGSDVLYALLSWPTYFLFFMVAVHVVKIVVTHYLPEGRWDRRKPLWRLAMLAQSPEIVIAAVAATLAV